MSFTSVCPKCGVKGRFLNNMEGEDVRCEECGRSYVALKGKAVEEKPARNEPDLAAELAKLRTVLNRMFYARVVWNLILLILGVGSFFWVQHHGKVAQQGVEQNLQHLQNLLDPRP